MSRESKEPCISPGIDDSLFTYSVSVATLLDVTTANNRIDGVYILLTLKGIYDSLWQVASPLPYKLDLLFTEEG